jgi:hypothetical protein
MSIDRLLDTLASGIAGVVVPWHGALSVHAGRVSESEWAAPHDHHHCRDDHENYEDCLEPATCMDRRIELDQVAETQNPGHKQDDEQRQNENHMTHLH